jgi:hypothetical protein
MYYGFNEHACVYINHGFVLATELTPASVNDSVYLPYCITALVTAGQRIMEYMKFLL